MNETGTAEKPAKNGAQTDKLLIDIFRNLLLIEIELLGVRYVTQTAFSNSILLAY